MSLARFFGTEPSIFSNEFRSLFNEIDRAFGERTLGSAWPGLAATSSFQDYQFVPRVRLAEENDQYKVEAEVPGFPKESLNLRFQDERTLLLSGNYQQEHHEEPQQEDGGQRVQVKDKDQGNDKQKQASTAVSKTSGDTQVSTNIQQPRIWRDERISQSFQRQIVFPSPVNQDAVQASLDHGILKLCVPKLAEEKQRKRIEIA